MSEMFVSASTDNHMASTSSSASFVGWSYQQSDSLSANSAEKYLYMYRANSR